MLSNNNKFINFQCLLQVLIIINCIKLYQQPLQLPFQQKTPHSNNNNKYKQYQCNLCINNNTKNNLQIHYHKLFLINLHIILHLLSLYSLSSINHNNKNNSNHHNRKSSL